MKSIVAEEEDKYLIRWEDDVVTGDPRPDTWELKQNANREAIDDWKRRSDKKKSKQVAFHASMALS